MQNPNEHVTAPEEVMQIDLVPEFLPTVGFENNLTAMDVFRRYLFTYSTSIQHSKAVANVLINIMTKHAYLATTIISDKGSTFVSHVNKLVADVLGLTLSTSLQSTHKQSGCSNDLTCQSNKHRIVKQANEDPCGINTSALWCLITILLITQAFAVSLEEFFVEVFLTIF